MKARVFFYCAAVVALVLFLAAVPSHATERRDPFVVPDTTQTQSAKPVGSAQATPSQKKHAPRSSQKKKETGVSAEKNSPAAGQNAGSSHDGVGTSSSAK